MRSAAACVVVAMLAVGTTVAAAPSTAATEAASPTTRAAWDQLRHSPLAVAARQAKVDAVRGLLAKPVDRDVLGAALYASLRDALDGFDGHGVPVPYMTDDAPDAVGLDVGRELTTITKLLLDAGADPNARPFGDRPVLLRAAAEGTPEQIALLLKAGADVNAVPADEPGHTALSEAISHDRYEISRQLLDAGAHVRNGEVASDAALNLPPEDPALLRLLLERGADVSTYRIVEREGKTARFAGPGGRCLISAVRAENVEVVAILLDHGVREPEILYEAAQAMFEVTQERRLAREQPPRDRAGVIDRRRARVLNLLLDEGLDPSAPDGTGLLLLAATGDGRSVQILSQHGAKVDAERYVQWILKSADEQAKRNLATLPPHERYAGLYEDPTIYNDIAVIQALREAGVPMPIGTAALVGDLNRVRELLKIDPALANKYPAGNGGFGPLRMAAKGGNLEVCKLLIDAGAEVMPSKVGSQGWGGMTPLEAAAAGGHVDVVKLLLAHGARVNVSNLTDTDTTLVEHLESYIARKAKDDEDAQQLLGIMQVLPLLKEAAATQPSATSTPTH